VVPSRDLLNNYIRIGIQHQGSTPLHHKLAPSNKTRKRIENSQVPEIPCALAAWASMSLPFASPMQYKLGTYI